MKQYGLVTATVIFLIFIGVSCSPVPTGPNIILISLDTTRADHIGCYGGDLAQTPNLDALAEESILFQDYRTVVPTTLASHTTLFTGKYPHTHGVPRNGFVINRKNKLLSEILQDAGYSTIGVIGSFALDSRFQLARGFHQYDEDFSLLAGTDGREQSQRPADEVTSKAIEYLQNHKQKRPFFLFAHYFDPHTPYEPPEPYDKMYDPNPGLKPPDMAAAIGQLQKVKRKTPAAARLAALYAGEVTFMDEQIGELFRYLKENGLYDDSLILVTSDHGENFWEHELYFNHGLNVYETVMRAVAILRLPQASHGGTKISGSISNVDILPTLLHYLDYAIPVESEGEVIDLVELPSRLPARPIFGEASKPWEKVEQGQKWTNALKSRSVIEDETKYIRVPYRKEEELYNLKADPYEQHNLLKTATGLYSAEAERMRAVLEQWSASANPLSSHFDASQIDETVRRLKDLGYLQ